MNQNIVKQKDCIFCESKLSKILFSTKDFIVALDDFPLIEGHLLIFSKEHYGCGGELPKTSLSKLVQIKNSISSMLRKEYGKVSFYEHGRAGHCVSFGPDERLCHHFHLHALPISHDISDILDNQFQKADMPSYVLIDDYFKKFGEYLYFENNNEKAMFYPVVSQIPPHLLRTLIANALQAPERADWENFNDKKFIHNALNQAQKNIRLKL